MTLTVEFKVTLDSQYVAPDGRSFGLVGKKHSHFVGADITLLTASTAFERLDDGDFRGDTVSGKKGDRFVYFGLQQSGVWLRRWKLRQHQLNSIFAAGDSHPVIVSIFLGEEVTPTVSICS